MHLGKSRVVGVIQIHLAHDARVPVAVVMEHAVRDILMRAVYGDVIDIRHSMLDGSPLRRSGILFLEPFVIGDVAAQLLLLARQAKANLSFVRLLAERPEM